MQQVQNNNSTFGKVLSAATTLVTYAAKAAYNRVRENPYETGGALLGAASFGLGLRGALAKPGERRWPWYTGSAIAGVASVASFIKSSRLNLPPPPPVTISELKGTTGDGLPTRKPYNIKMLTDRLNAAAGALGLNTKLNEDQVSVLYWAGKDFQRTKDKAKFIDRATKVLGGGEIDPEDMSLIMDADVEDLPEIMQQVAASVANQLKKADEMNAQLGLRVDSKGILGTAPPTKEEIKRIIEERRKRLDKLNSAKS